MSKTIYITRSIPDIGVQILKENGYEVDVRQGAEVPTQEELLSALRAKPYDAVLSLLTDKIDSAMFDAVPSIKLVANFATGFDNIDLVEAGKRGIVVTNAPAPLASEAVAEHTIALMFALAARIVEADEFVRRSNFTGWSPMNFIGTDVLGKTLGLVGAGRIGERVAHYAHGLGLTILYSDVVRNERIEKEYCAEYCESIDTLLPKSDIVSLHVPLLESTRHLMNEARLHAMKPTAMLINTSRGGAIDEVALEKALRDGTISAAALDVFEREPEITPGLIELQNVILTPHIASASIEARNQMAEIAAQNIVDFFEGKTPRNVVTHTA